MLLGYDEGEEPEKLIAEAERMLMELGSRRVASAFFSIKDILLNTFSHLEYLYNNRGSITGVPTSFSDLDRLCSGLQPSNFIILAGRPSMEQKPVLACVSPITQP